MVTGRKINPKGAVQKLEELDFDPLEAQIAMYKHLLIEIKAQEDIRDKKLVRLNANGSEKAYRVDFHMGLVEKASIIAEKLTRYGYARVSEQDQDKVPVNPVLNIHLTDGEGNQKKFVLNGSDDDGGDLSTSDTE